MANVTYQVYVGGRWLPNVTNLNDYAGIYGTPIQAVYANLSSGSIQYRTHTQNGKWLPWVSDRSDYAGIYGRNIDGLQMKITGLPGCDVRYRTYVGGRWLPWVTGTSDYAGIYGQTISGIQVEIISHGGSGGSGGSGGTKPNPIPDGTAGSKASANIIYYIKGIEGFAPNYYFDSVGVRTLGYGMTGSELNGVSTPLSEATGAKYLANNLNNSYYSKVLNIVKSRGVSNPKQREIDAFASFAYNLGVGAFSSSTLLNKYAAGERGESIHKEFKKWVHAGGQVLNGLVRRREEEWNIFSGSSTKVGGWNCPPSINIIGGRGNITDNNGYGANPY